MQEKIQQQNEFLQSVFESVTHPFYVIDANDYTITMANSAANLGRITGIATCYALAHRIDKPCHSEEHPCPLEMIKKTKKPATVEHIHYDKDGNARNIEIHGFPIFDSEGNLVQMIEYCLDSLKPKLQSLLAATTTSDAMRLLVKKKWKPELKLSSLLPATYNLITLTYNSNS